MLSILCCRNIVLCPDANFQQQLLCVSNISKIHLLFGLIYISTSCWTDAHEKTSPFQIHYYMRCCCKTTRTSEYSPSPQLWKAFWSELFTKYGLFSVFVLMVPQWCQNNNSSIIGLAFTAYKSSTCFNHNQVVCNSL